MTSTSSPSKRPIRRLLLLLCAAGAGVVALIAVGLQLPLWSWAAGAVDVLRSGDLLAIAGFSLIHIASIILFIPVSPFVFAAGFVWGTTGGTAIITADNLVGTTVAFLLAQRTLRPFVDRQIGDHRHVQAIDRAMALGGFTAVVMLRLSPIIPMSFLNYGLGLFRLEVSRYVAATTVGLLPITLLYCWGAAGLGELSDVAAGEVAAGPWQQAVFWVGLIATFATVWWLQRLAARALQQLPSTGGNG